MLSRSIGSILRGRGTPLQFMLACVLGALIGFTPGWSQAPGLIVALTLLLIIFNANLFLALMVGLLAKAFQLVTIKVSFAIGRVLIDGPTEPIFRKLINAPVLAFFGFDVYVVTGGIVLALILGVVSGLLVIFVVQSFRRKMAGLEEGSEKFKAWTSKGWVKALTWLLAGGGKGKKATYADLLNKKFGNPIRPLGAVFAVMVVALLWLVKSIAAGPIVESALRSGLEQANGATVDFKEAKVDLATGHLTIDGLAMADPENLKTDLLRADRLEAKISVADLLRKRLQLDRVALNNASTGEERKTPGHLTRPRQVPPPADPNEPGKSLEDYIAQAQLWKNRITQAKEWLDKLSGPGEQADPSSPANEKQKEETLRQRLDRQIREHGYAKVTATHLIEGSPTFTIVEFEALKLRAVKLNGETLDVVARNLSTHPSLLAGAPRITIKSAAGTLDLDLDLGGAAAKPTQNLIKLAVRNIPGDTIGSALAFSGTQPISGGTVGFSTEGTWTTGASGKIDLPLHVNLLNTVLAVPGGPPQRVEKFMLPIGVRGLASSPRISIDDKQLTQALVNAGISHAKALAAAEVDKVKAKAMDEVNQQAQQATQKLTEKAGAEVKSQASQFLGGFLGTPTPTTEKPATPATTTQPSQEKPAGTKKPGRKRPATQPAR